eukprot:TRINITY_DN905_c1_g1_i1.p1 TRINITY_DN905_c1_g1~~TRINITY_DN905_c1_g1_i1.p1  ORF type:complete len:487 (+),score=89.30 TRINITY_DN905_c1_g1_i1:1659-3119(+)
MIKRNNREGRYMSLFYFIFTSMFLILLIHFDCYSFNIFGFEVHWLCFVLLFMFLLKIFVSALRLFFWRMNYENRVSNDFMESSHQRINTDIPPYGVGWYFLTKSSEIKKGEIKSFYIFEKELILFRSTKKPFNVHLVSAICPHLGANLKEGIVEEDNIICGFHCWKFCGKTGKCIDIPYANNIKIPKQAKISNYEIFEQNGFIYVWYGSSKPSWKIPNIHKMSLPTTFCDNLNPNYGYHGSSLHEVSVHMQEIGENGADNVHLIFLHTSYIFRFFRFIGFNHTWKTSWKNNKSKFTYDEPYRFPLFKTKKAYDNINRDDDDDKNNNENNNNNNNNNNEEKKLVNEKINKNNHLAHCNLQQQTSWLNLPIPGSLVKVRVNMVGPALVFIHLDTVFGRIYIKQCITPTRPQFQIVRHYIFSDNTVPRVIAKLVLKSVIIQFERDTKIWNTKDYVHKPILVKEDGKILEFRRWFSQFYSDYDDNKYLDW